MGFQAQPLAGAAARALYLQARVLWNRRTPDSIREAMGHLQRAIAMDGPFPLASAALADSFSVLMDYGVVSPKEGLTPARLAAGRALHHAPHLPESLTASALVRHMALDWKGAEEEFRAAIRAHPGFAPARQRYALFLAGMGRYLESRREMGRALALDPHTPAVAASFAWIEYYGGRFSEGAQAARNALDRHPELPAARAALGSALVQLGHPGRAAAALEVPLRLEPGNVSLLALLCYARSREGEQGEARALLARLRDSSSNRYVSPYYLALALLGTEGEDEALLALEAAADEGSPHLAYLAVEPAFSVLRPRERFREILRRIAHPGWGPSQAPEPQEPREPRTLPRPGAVVLAWQSRGFQEGEEDHAGGLPSAETVP
jgi:tetratricopeptide (TPR) repeat protein